jgi:D-sedoheptulose 7-phosphate isomerase
MIIPTDEFCRDYVRRLHSAFDAGDTATVGKLANALLQARETRAHVFLVGNGGSAANAIHLANDFLFGLSRDLVGPGLRVEALAANSSVLTCLANDLSYEDVFSHQLTVKADPGDILIALSGSGNSPNILRALETGNTIGMQTFAILGFTGGQALQKAHTAIHFAIDDMQIAEDLQMMVGHICMQLVRARLKQFQEQAP